MLGSKIVFENLIKNNIKYVFGYPGGAILPVLNQFYNQDKIKYIMSRTELGGSFMAEGYSKSTNQPGVIMTTSGPGATNIITSLQNSLSDGTPILALCGQVSTEVIGTDAFQEANIINMTKTCTKWNYQIKNGKLIDKKLDYGFYKMFENRHGPVLIDLPKNIMSSIHSKQDIFKLNNNKSLKNNNIDIEKINELILNSKQPLILAGQGVLQSNSQFLLRNFSLHYKIPITTTLLGLGIVDEKSMLSLKMLGMHGSYSANNAIQNCDLLINFGCRFDDRITGDPKKFAQKAKIIHIDINNSNIGKVIGKVIGKDLNPNFFYINEDCKIILNKLLEKKINKNIQNEEWFLKINQWKKIKFSFPDKNNIQGRYFLSILNKVIHEDYFNNYTILADVGAHQMWTAQFIDYDYPKVKFITSGGLGSMGFALPASIGAKLGVPNDIVICIVGDGGFTMSMVELLTAVDNKINIKVFIINNSSQSMVVQWQKMFYDNRIIGTLMKNPSFEKICESMGCKSIIIDSKFNIEKKICEILDYNDGPIVANIITDSDEPVIPFVIPGSSLDNMIIDENKECKIENTDAPC